ncbi:MAG: ArsA family ATPase [Clostridia bacterium]|nr:ArsA family ATPase [Clostridia bacterium]
MALASSIELEKLIEKKHDQKIIIVTGKGGVGKTVTACAIAAHTSKSGSKTLLVTTDPAAHIGYVLNEKVGSEIAKVINVPNEPLLCID